MKLSHFFCRSFRIGTLNRVLFHLAELTAAWLVSIVLQSVINGDWSSLFRTSMITAFFLFFSLFPLQKLDRLSGKSCQNDLQNYRQFLCNSVIVGRLKIDTVGELDTRLQRDATTISDYYSSDCPKALAAGLMILTCLTLLICTEWHLAVIICLLSFTQLFPTIVYEKWAKAIYEQTQYDEEEYCNWIVEGLTGIRTLKSYQQEQWYLKRYRGYHTAIIQSGIRAERTGTVETIISDLISSLLSYGVYIIVGFFILAFNLHISRVPLILVLAHNVFSATETLMKSRISQFKCQQASTRLGIKKENCEITASQKSTVEALNVSKTIDGKKILSDVSLAIQSGDRILLSGPNGAGKTTLMRILLGFMEPTSGKVLLAQCTKAFCFQEDPPLKIPAEQILTAMKSSGIVDDQKLQEHLQIFRINDILQRAPVEFSEGQRKKFYLAVAMARNADFLVLDEPSNHLDEKSVDYLVSFLQSFTGTLLICTHDERISLPWNRKIQIKEGKVCEEK